jgi:hypothetical protein
MLSTGGTPLHCASSIGTVGLLLANGADPTMRMADPPLSSFDIFLVNRGQCYDFRKIWAKIANFIIFYLLCKTVC